MKHDFRLARRGLEWIALMKRRIHEGACGGGGMAPQMRFVPLQLVLTLCGRDLVLHRNHMTLTAAPIARIKPDVESVAAGNGLLSFDMNEIHLAEGEPLYEGDTGVASWPSTRPREPR